MTHAALSVRTYALVFGGLLLLTALTVGAAYAPLGPWHEGVALAIAALKATLVLLFFMHLLRSHRLVWIVAGGTILWLGILVTLTLSDYLTRHWLPGATPDYQPVAPRVLPRP